MKKKILIILISIISIAAVATISTNLYIKKAENDKFISELSTALRDSKAVFATSTAIIANKKTRIIDSINECKTSHTKIKENEVELRKINSNGNSTTIEKSIEYNREIMSFFELSNEYLENGVSILQNLSSADKISQIASSENNKSAVQFYLKEITSYESKANKAKENHFILKENILSSLDRIKKMSTELSKSIDSGSLLTNEEVSIGETFTNGFLSSLNQD